MFSWQMLHKPTAIGVTFPAGGCDAGIHLGVAHHLLLTLKNIPDMYLLKMSRFSTYTELLYIVLMGQQPVPHSLYSESGTSATQNLIPTLSIDLTSPLHLTHRTYGQKGLS
ncbi:hypothetical protein UY3_13486 [Chelonia mydas]|uniref:Uncharacterized protein n=1 Tax=Chelonia mydas TaxID=8469 RepID=M7BB82_CHEMY|nr:hypothetical protein UY3_13486 [Chelonia mydas]